MAKKKAKTAKKPATPKTTAQQLGSLIKSARDIMRKDKGLNGDLDRLPLLTWVMFLKFLDDREKLQEARAEIAGKKYKSAIEAPYRWRDWATDKDGITGDELIAFVNQDEATRPDGSRGLGLLAYLRGLQATADDRRRGVIATVFDGVTNRMLSGYLLRDVINLVDGIHFDSTDEIHTLARLYESMLREMRDAAGDSGEFYTPRPVVQFMVQVTNPQLGEVMLDPACGTGGFLSETFEHLEKQCNTVQQRKTLQEKSIYGGEAKPLPYMLAQMNLLLHGLDAPSIDYGNSLTVKITELGAKDRVDIILTNPSFGGEEEAGIRNNFPADKQTSETALLFLQLIMRKLRKPTGSNAIGGRAGVVVPNGTLYASGVAARIRGELISKFHLDVVVRLPKGVFEPYADIPTNVLFFSASPPADHVWFYEHPLPADRAALKSPSYSKSRPLELKEFEPMFSWWCDREENSYAWSVPTKDLEEQDWNLDQRNPHSQEYSHLSPSGEGKKAINFAKDLLADAKEFHRNLSEIESTFKKIEGATTVSIKLGDACDLTKGRFPTKKTLPGEYRFYVLAADERTANDYQFDAEGVIIPTISSTGHGHASIHRLYHATGQFAVANILACAVVKEGVPLLSKYLFYYLTRFKEEKLVSLMAGTANTSLTIGKLKTVDLLLPDMKIQESIVKRLDDAQVSSHALRNGVSELNRVIDDVSDGAVRFLIRS